MKLEVVGDDYPDSPSRVGQWSQGPMPPRPDADQVRIIQWARRAVSESTSRSEKSIEDAFACWTAAGEAAWWVSALGELLDGLVGGKMVYRSGRDQDDYGQSVVGLRWLRSLHIHRIRVSGAGGPKKPFFAPPDADYLFYISPSNRWLPSDQLAPRADEKNIAQRQQYDLRVADRPLRAPLDAAMVWFDRVISASGFQSTDNSQDGSVL